MDETSRRVAYVAGPMRGYPRHNFDKFAEVTAALRDQGWVVISPAELDLAVGYDPEVTPTAEQLVEMFERDLDAINKVDTIVLLPGWRESLGVHVELNHAYKIRKCKPELKEWDDESQRAKPLDWAGIVGKIVGAT